MADAAIDVRREGLIEFLLDFHTMAVWEVLRRAGKPLPVLALAEWADSPLAVTQHALDQLESFGLVKRLPAAGRRRTITYEVTCDHIAIAGDLQKPDEAALFKSYYERFAAHTEAVLMLAELLRRYDFEPLAPGAVRPVARLTTRPARQVMCRVTRAA